MKSDVETLQPTRVKLTVEVPFDELKPSIDKAYGDIAGQISVPGFRRGKVPPPIIDQRVGREVVLQEAINGALPEFYGRAATEHDVRPVGEPEVEVTKVPDLKDGGDLAFTIEVDVRPEVTLPELGEIAVEVDDIEVTDDDVTEQLDVLRERFGTLKSVDRPAEDGDFVTINLTASIDDDEVDAADGISYQIGAGNMLDGMDEALTGLSADEDTVFNAELRGGEHEGKTAEIRVELTAVKERELPEADDDFAELASEFDTLDELTADLREKVTEQKKLQQIGQAQEKFLETLREKLEVPVPKAMLDEEVNQVLQNEGQTDNAERRTEIEKEADRVLQRQMILDAMAKREDVDVTEQELINHIVATAPQYGMDPQTFANMVEEAGQIPALVSEVGRRKALLLCLSDAKVTNSAGEALDLGLVEEVDDEAGDEDSDAPESVTDVTETDETAKTS